MMMMMMMMTMMMIMVIMMIKVTIVEDIRTNKECVCNTLQSLFEFNWPTQTIN